MAEEKTLLNFSLISEDSNDKFFYTCNADFDVLVSSLYTVAKEDLFTREALKLVGDFINEEFYKENINQ
tara:strand:+ start:223 stop:429 length:207 start_codon:yes stop_codon:yes gene_type:complete